MLQIAILGAGAMAREHIRAFADVPDVKIAGISSRTRAKAEALAAEFNIPHVCDSIAELYERTQADVVVVAVSADTLKDVTISCLPYPWLMFIEKPPGLNFAETAVLQTAAQGKPVYVGLNRRFLSSTQAALADLDNQPGQRHILVQDQQDVRLLARVHPPHIVANLMYGNSIHLFDYLPLFGRGAITAITPIFRWDAANPGIVAASITFDSGDNGLYQGIWNGPGPWAVSISTPDARWEMRPLETANVQRRGERTRTEAEIHAWDKAFKPGFRLQAEQVIRAARGEPNELPTLDDAAATMRLIAEIFK